jgi:hypothetical protein
MNLSSIRVCVLCWWAATAAALCGQAPVNDEPSGAIALASGVNPSAPAGADSAFFSNQGATDSVGLTTCHPQQPQRDVFFTYVAEHTGHTVFSLCRPAGMVPGTLVAARIHVYNSAGTILLGCDYGACAGFDDDGLSACHFSTVVNVTYLIRVGSHESNERPTPGTFRVVVVKSETPADACASATPLPSLDGAVSGTTVGCTAVGLPSSACNSVIPSAPDVWYSFTPTSNGFFAAAVEIVRLSAGTATLDSFLTMRQARLFDASAGCGALVEISCGAQFPELGAAVVAGTPYLVAIGKDAASFGGRFLLSTRFVPTAQANDACANATPIAAGTTDGQTFGATVGDVPGSTSPDVWYAFTASHTGPVVAWALSSTSQLAVYSGSCGALAAYGVGQGVPFSPSRFFAFAGATYLLRVARFPTPVGFPEPPDAFSLTLIADAPASNATVATPLEIFDGLNPPVGDPPLTTLGGEIDVTTATGAVEPVVWLRHVATTDGLLLETCTSPGSVEKPRFTVFADLGGVPGASLGSSATFCDGGALSSFLVNAGSAYLIRMTTGSAMTAAVRTAGTFTLYVRHIATGAVFPPCNIPGTFPSLTGTLPLIGAPVLLTARFLPPDATSVTFFGGLCPAAPFSISAGPGNGFCLVHVDAFDPSFFVLATVPVVSVPGNTTTGLLPLVIPPDPTLDGARVCLQAGGSSFQAPLFLTTGLEAVLGL